MVPLVEETWAESHQGVVAAPVQSPMPPAIGSEMLRAAESCKCDESMETNTVNWRPFRESVPIYGTTKKLHRFSAFDSSINLLNFELPW